MCTTCGCDDPGLEIEKGRAPVGVHAGARTVRLERDVLAKNDALAAENRRWLASHRILAWNLVSSPGAGKTSLLERLIPMLGKRVPVSVIEGDQATENDAVRVRAAGARAHQVNTGVGCHLDATMVKTALDAIEPPAGSVLFIENVGNLVCPALFDLGERAKAVIASVTEGEDKPLKYPHMFKASDVLVLNKIDLLPHLRFDVDRFLAHAREVNPRQKVFRVSAETGQGLDELAAWFAGEVHSG
jgi:hydrogenase nickel incorporation protein HypB